MAISIAARAFSQWITRPELGPTWGEAADLYESEFLPGLAPASRLTYASWLRTARACSIGGRPLVDWRLAELRLQHCRLIARQLAEHPVQGFAVAKLIGRVVQYANDAGVWSGSNPARSLRGNPARRREHPLDLEQLRAVQRALELPEVGMPADRLAVRLLAQTGWRIGEALRLSIGCAQLRVWHGYAYAVCRLDTKAGRRDLPISGAAFATVRRASADRVVGPVFARPDGSVPAPQTLRAVLARACEAAGVPRRVPHDLRHTFASTVLRGAPVGDVAALLGHTTPQMTLRYCHGAHEGICHALQLAEAVDA